MYTVLSTLKRLRANKTAFQVILLLLAEWNEIELQFIAKKRALLANVAAMWSKLTNADKEISDIWRMLLKDLIQELTMRWDAAVSARKVYEDVLGKTVSHLEERSPPSERHLLVAIHAASDAEMAAKHTYKKNNNRNDKFTIGSDKTQSVALEIGKTDLAYRQKHAQLNSLRRKFVGEAKDAYADLIEEQHGIVNTVKMTLSSYMETRAKHACHVVRTTSRLTDTLAAFSPFDLSARHHYQLQLDLQLPQYTPASFIDPKAGDIRSRPLVGVDFRDEENPDNSLLAVLLDTPLAYLGGLKRRPSTRRTCPTQVHKELSSLESNWFSEPLENKAMLSRRSFEIRHSLIILYLSYLPVPLLPLSNQQYTQLALRQTTLYTFLETLPPENIKLLGDLCHYLSRLYPNDDDVLKQFGKLILKAENDLISDGSRNLMARLMVYFKKIKERAVLDIAPTTPSEWGSIWELAPGHRTFSVLYPAFSVQKNSRGNLCQE